MKANKERIELSQIQLPIADFMKLYNQGIPASFPAASMAALKEFQATHLSLFNNRDMWSIAQHRKRLMDWLFGYHAE